jgi:peptidoglycan hydrolase CwlO-like protein
MGSEDTLITEIPGTTAEAMADAIIEVYGDTPQTQALIQNINDGDIEGTRTRANDLFNGEAESSSVHFRRMMEILGGGGGAFGDSLAHPRGYYDTPEGRRERAAQQAMLSLLEQQRRVLEQKIEEKQREIRRIDEQISHFRQENEQLQIQLGVEEQRLAEINESLETLRDRVNDIGRQSRRAIDILGQLDPAAEQELRIVRQAATHLVTIKAEVPGLDCVPPRRHAVYRDTENPEQYYILHPTTSQRINVQDLPESTDRFTMIQDIEYQLAQGGRNGAPKNFANDPGMERHVANYNDHYPVYLNLINTSQDVEQRVTITSLQDMERDAQIEIFELEREKQQITQRIDEIKAEMARNNLKINELEATRAQRVADLAELQTQLDDINIRMEQATQDIENTSIAFTSITSQSENITKFLRGEIDENQMREYLRDAPPGIADLIVKCQREQQKAAESEQASDMVTQAMAGFQDRHSQLRDLFRRDRAAFDDAQTHPIEYNGQMVYRNNTTQELYTFENGERHIITDAAALADLYKQAYADTRLFANETHQGVDPENTFQDTLRATTLASGNLTGSAQGAAAQARQQADTSVAQLAAVTDIPADQIARSASGPRSPELRAAHRWEGTEDTRCLRTQFSCAATSPAATNVSPAPAAAPVS